MTRLLAFALIAASLLIVVALAIPRRLPESGANAPADRQPAPVESPAGVSAVEPSAAGAAVTAPAPLASAMTAAPAADSANAAAQPGNEPSKQTAKSKSAKSRVTESSKSAASIGAATLAAEAPGKEDFGTMLSAPEPVAAAPVPGPASTESGLIAPVTITGCLEISTDQETFRLTKAEGLDAPKSRSWRTGFLKKRSAPVVLVEPPDPHALQMEVGKRVAATGQLTSHELKVSSLHVVGPSCY